MRFTSSAREGSARNCCASAGWTVSRGSQGLLGTELRGSPVPRKTSLRSSLPRLTARFPPSSPEETIPLFTEVLDVLSKGAGPVIVELKSGKRNDELCEKTRELLRGYPGIYCVESFDPGIVNWFRKNAPEIIRGQLAMPASHYAAGTNPLLARLLAGCRFSVLNRPDFIAYQVGPRPDRMLRMRQKGVLLIGWTSHDYKKDAKENDGVIFESCTPPLRYDL